MVSMKDVKPRLLNAVKYVRSRGYQPIYISLYGSQNYGLDTNQSDFDFKCIVLPTVDDLINGVFISVVLPYEDGIIEVKDIREHVACLKKMNPAYLETFITPYFVSASDIPEIDEIKELIPNLLVERGRPYMEALFGIYSRYAAKALVDGGKDYNPKAAYQALRMVCMMESYMGSKEFLIVPGENDMQCIMNVKMHKFQKEFFLPLFETVRISACSLIDAARTTFSEPSYETANRIKELADQVVRNFVTIGKKIIIPGD